MTRYRRKKRDNYLDRHHEHEGGLGHGGKARKHE